MNKPLFFILLFNFFLLLSNGQEREILIIGTMHTVPKIVKGSYRPLLRYTKKYDPKAIYVESPMPNDHQSWTYLKNGWSKQYQWFFQYSDSLQRKYAFDEERFDALLFKKLENLNEEDLDTLMIGFAYLRDNANYEYYQYIKRYGIKGSKKPTRHEDGDLTAKLALAKNINRLRSMDDQQTNKEYHDAWKSCAKAGRLNGDNEINRALNKKDYNSAVIPALMGRLGKHVNKRKSLDRLHQLSSFTYVENHTESCSMGERYWNERNKRMAQNIGRQVLSNQEKKSVVIVGAAHVIGIEKELRTQFPDLRVKLMFE